MRDHLENFLFDREVLGEHWCFDPNLSLPQLSDDSLKDEILSLLRRSSEWKERYTSDQIAYGIKYLISPSYSDMAFLFLAQDVDKTQKIEFISVFGEIFENVFEKLCSGALMHKSVDASRIDALCYMWWDIFPLTSGFELEEVVVEKVFNVIKTQLKSANYTCVESGLHGLGHLYHLHPRLVRSAILRARIPPCLKKYSLAAMKGSVV